MAPLLPDPEFAGVETTVRALVQILQTQLGDELGAIDLPIRDGEGREIVGAGGVRVYDPASGQAIITPERVTIDTQHLADAAVTLRQLDDSQVVTATKVVARDTVTMNLLAGEVEALTAEIDNLRVNDAQIRNLSADKLTSGVIRASDIFVGTSRFNIDGRSERLVIDDTNDVRRVELGRIGSDYGLILRDAVGRAFLDERGVDGRALHTAVDHTLLQVPALSALTANLGHVTAGTIDAAQVDIINLDVVGTFRSGTGGDRIVMGENGAQMAVYEAGRKILTLQSYSSLDPFFGMSASRATPLMAVTNKATFGGFARAAQFEARSSRAAAIQATNAADGIAISVPEGSLDVDTRDTWAIQGRSNAQDANYFTGTAKTAIVASGPSFAGYAVDGTWGPFTAAHEAVMAKTDKPPFGSLVVDVGVLGRRPWDDATTEVATATRARDPRVLGVLTRRMPIDPGDTAGLLALQEVRHVEERVRDADGAPTSAIARVARRRRLAPAHRHLVESHDHVVVNALGEGLIRVCGANGDVPAGGLLCSAPEPGCAMWQGEDIQRNHTVARAREAATFARADEVQSIACVYKSG